MPALTRRIGNAWRQGRFSLGQWWIHRRGRKPPKAIASRIGGDLACARTGGSRKPHHPTLAALDALTLELASVSGVTDWVIEIESLPAAYDRVIEARRFLARVRAAGIRVTAVLVGRGTREYLLADACDRVVLTPGAGLSLTGLAGESYYLRTALAKLGVAIEVYRAGKFKSAMEPFIADAPSEAALEAQAALLDGVHATLCAALATGRAGTPEKAAEWLAKGPWTGAEALAEGLVDRIDHAAAIFAELAPGNHSEKKRAEPPRLPKLPPLSAALRFGTRPPLPRVVGGPDRHVGVIHLSGMITQNPARRGPFATGGIDWPTTRKLIERAAADRDLCALVVWLDTGGGDALASELIYDLLKRLDAHVPVVAFMDRAAASGGYYIAAAARHIVALPGTLTGSIGVFRPRPVAGDLLARLGVTPHRMSRGGRENLASITASLSDDDKARVQAEIDELYTTFVSRAAAARNRPFGELEALAQGRVWLGRDALANGLVDELGTLDTAIEKAWALAGQPRPGDPAFPAYRDGPPVVLVAEPRSLFERLRERVLGGLTGGARAFDGIDAALPPALAALVTVLRAGGGEQADSGAIVAIDSLPLICTGAPLALATQGLRLDSI
jgi:protease IV